MTGADTPSFAGRVDSEAELIRRFLAPLAAGAPGAFALADDCALLDLPAGVVATMDPIIAGVHFFPDDRPDDIAWKVLAVNASDLAAKAARPVAYLMAMAFPDAPERVWMRDFAAGLAAAQNAFGCTLIGGDTDRTTGPLSISVTMLGVPARIADHQGVRYVGRRGAAAGDQLFVTGTIGDAGLGLELRRNPEHYAEAPLTGGDTSFLIGRYLRPNPRLALRDTLAQFASAALDISDGLIKDARRLADACGLKLTLDLAAMPLSPPARRIVASVPDRLPFLASCGDDYEILFSVPAGSVDAMQQALAGVAVQVTRVGVLEDGGNHEILDQTGTPLTLESHGWDHF